MKLKPCPFCGGRAKMHLVVADGDPNDGGKYIACESCNAGSAIMFPLMESVDALLSEKWNKRAKKEASDG